MRIWSKTAAAVALVALFTSGLTTLGVGTAMAAPTAQMPEKHEPGAVREAPEGGGEPPTEAWTPPAEEQAASSGEPVGAQPEAQARSGVDAEAPAQAASDPFNSKAAGLTDFYAYEEFPHFGDALDVRVNVGNGNLYLSSDVIAMNGPGVQPSMTTFYNSRSFLYSTMGILDYANAGLQFNGDTILYHDRTGKVWEFTKSGTTWVSPPGRGPDRGRRRHLAPGRPLRPVPGE